jgi:xanthine dehydrogenase accessory factor
VDWGVVIERRQIVDLVSRRGSSDGVLITLVRVEGSSYRRPGAMLLSMDEEYAGMISGGCLESEVAKKAKWFVQLGAVMKQYSTVFDDTAEIPYGLGCGGTIDLLFEPMGTREFEALLRAMKNSLDGERTGSITWLPSETAPMQRAIISGAGEVVFQSEDLTSDKIECVLKGEAENVFVEWLEPPQRLIVVGAGDDAKPMVRTAALMGWRITVVDGRAHLPTAKRFPEAEQVLAIPAGKLDGLDIKPSDAVVLMTHAYDQDREWLAAILPLTPRYLGLLGAKHRSSLLVAETSALTGIPIAQCCERIHAPVGLDLGGDGPEAIALAVISEVQACCMGRGGASRRLSPADVAEQIKRGGSSRYLQSQCAL